MPEDGAPADTPPQDGVPHDGVPQNSASALDQAELDRVVGGSEYPALGRVIGLLAQGQLMPALDALDALVSVPDRDVQPRAILLLAWINEEQGNTEYMMNAYAHAADSGHPQIAPYASLRLAGKFLDHGDVTQARRFLKRAARAADPDVSGTARRALDALPKTGWQKMTGR